MRAGVSTATASRALRGDSRISTACIDRVVSAAKEMEYKPLRRRKGSLPQSNLRGRTVGLLLLGMARSLETLPVVASAIHGTEAAVTAGGGSLLLREITDLDALPASLDSARFDGLILKGALQGDLIRAMGSKLLSRLRALPSVWLLGKPAGAWGDVVGAEDFEVGRLAAEHLLENGHRDVAFLSPKSGHVTFGRRQSSFTWHIQQAGGVVRAFAGGDPQRWSLPLQAAQGVESVQQLVDELLASRSRPTAVFVPADNMTALVYRALVARGVEIGNEISVISANNERTICDGLFPDLTTIDTHSDVVGHRAVDQLLWRLGHPDVKSDVTLSIAPDLLPGRSVRRLSHGPSPQPPQAD